MPKYSLDKYQKDFSEKGYSYLEVNGYQKYEAGIDIPYGDYIIGLDIPGNLYIRTDNRGRILFDQTLKKSDDADFDLVTSKIISLSTGDKLFIQLSNVSDNILPVSIPIYTKEWLDSDYVDAFLWY